MTEDDNVRGGKTWKDQGYKKVKKRCEGASIMKDEGRGWAKNGHKGGELNERQKEMLEKKN